MPTKSGQVKPRTCRRSSAILIPWFYQGYSERECHDRSRKILHLFFFCMRRHPSRQNICSTHMSMCLTCVSPFITFAGRYVHIYYYIDTTKIFSPVGNLQECVPKWNRNEMDNLSWKKEDEKEEKKEVSWYGWHHLSDVKQKSGHVLSRVCKKLKTVPPRICQREVVQHNYDWHEQIKEKRKRNITWINN